MKIFIDIDGVVADFVGGVQKKLGREVSPWPRPGVYDFMSVYGIKIETFEEIMSDENFWIGLDVLENGKFLIENCLNGHDLYFLTTPQPTPACLSGKINWIYDNFPDMVKKTIFCQDKAVCANSNSVLIDDSFTNCTDFAEAGGKVILYPQPWNKFHNDTVIQLPSTLKQLRRISS